MVGVAYVYPQGNDYTWRSPLLLRFLSFQNILNFADEHGRSNPELGAKLHDCTQGRAANATFEQADIRSVKSTLKSQLILWYAPLLTQCSKCLSEGLLRPAGGLNLSGVPVACMPLRHQTNVDRLWTIVIRTIVGIESRLRSFREHGCLIT